MVRDLLDRHAGQLIERGGVGHFADVREPDVLHLAVLLLDVVGDQWAAQPNLTLTFGLDMILYNLIVVFFSPTPRRVTLDLGAFEFLGVILPGDRLAGMVLAGLLTGLLLVVMRASKIGRAIVAVRMDRTAAELMGIRVNQIYAITFGIGALMAGSAGTVFAMVFPISVNLSGILLGKAFVVCVIGGLGSVSGALVGGLALGLIESFSGVFLGAEHALTVGFVLMLFLLLVKPTGLVGTKGYE